MGTQHQLHPDILKIAREAYESHGILATYVLMKDYNMCYRDACQALRELALSKRKGEYSENSSFI